MKKFVFLFLVVAIGLIGIEYISFIGDVNAKSRVKPITIDYELKSIMLSDTLKDVQEEATEEADTTYLFLKEGTASWYGDPNHKRDHYDGRTTASGERMNTWDMIVAYNDRSLIKRKALMRVTNLKNGKSVIVRCLDSGGFGKLGRILDVSYGVKEAIGMGDLGKVRVELVHINKK